MLLPQKLANLFHEKNDDPEFGKFMAQRFIDFLSNNEVLLRKMHWCQLEKLTAEFFEQAGYLVDLGLGRNDDGVDVRVWKYLISDKDSSPTLIIQCKRQKADVDKVPVKGLAADVAFEGTTYDLIATTSQSNPGAKTTIEARGYPLEQIDRVSLGIWLSTLHTPETGVIKV
jgi:restriction system protein